MRAVRVGVHGRVGRNRLTDLEEFVQEQSMNSGASYFRFALATCLLSWGGWAGAAPNVLLIIADDYGFDKSSLYVSGEHVPPTPVIEALARDGVTYDNVWSSPSCSPTRATMITGQFGSRNGVPGVIVPPMEGLIHRLDYPHYLPRELDKLGYDTGMVGKWHLTRTGDGPALAGYDFFAGRPRSFGAGAGAPEDSIAAYWGGNLETWRCAPACEPVTFPESPRPAPVPDRLHGNYMTTWEVDQALGWISERADSPWFLWLAFQTPHAPLQLPPEHLVDPGLRERIKDHFGGYEAGLWVQEREDPVGGRIVFSAMVSAMDTEIGRLLEAVDHEETVVIFLGDNGTVASLADPAIVPGRRGKGSLYQGGIHVPMVIAGPGIEDRGRRSRALVHTSDVFSTVLDLAGADMGSDGVPASIPREVVIHGRSLATTLMGEPVPGREYLLAEGGAFAGNPAWDEQPRFGGRESTAIRNDRYKLMQATAPDENSGFICIHGPQPTVDDPVPCGRDERVKSYELYDLLNDPRESNDLLANGTDALEPDVRAVFVELRDAVARVRAGWR